MRRPAELKRQVALICSVTEHVLGRKLGSVLDAGCGEGAFRAPLLALRPTLYYLGVDGSEYVVSRYGRSRNLHLGDITALGRLRIEGRYDLVIANDVLHYLKPVALRAALAGIRELAGAVAYLPVYTRRDSITGDIDALERRSGARYRSEISRAGFFPIGLNHYIVPEWANVMSDMELSWVR